MINNVKFNFNSPFELSIIPFDDAEKIQFESYCRADYYQLVWITEGSTDFEIDMKLISVCKDSLLCIGKDMVYRYERKNDYKGYIVRFTDFFYCRSEQDISFLQHASIFNDSCNSVSLSELTYNSNILSIDFMLNKSGDEQDPLRDDVLHTVLKLILYRFEASSSKEYHPVFLDTNQLYIKEFKQLVNDHFIEHKELSFYTEKMGISSKQLLAATKQILGKNAKEVIIEKVIIEAKRFLTYSGFSVKQIAYCLGFNEPNNFSIFFNKYTGLTPGMFKKDVFYSNKIQNNA